MLIISSNPAELMF